jgi:hypothetical protein
VSGSERPNGATQKAPLPRFDDTLICQWCGGQSEQVELEIGLFAFWKKGCAKLLVLVYWYKIAWIPGFVDLDIVHTYMHIYNIMYTLH